MTEDTSEKLIRIGEAAEMLGVHPETLRRWDRDGKLNAVIINDRGDRRYKTSDVLAIINGPQSTESSKD